MLLDTHVWLWLQVSPQRIHPAVLATLEDSNSDLLLSTACAWEISVKWELGKLPLPEPPGTYVPERLRSQATRVLPIRLDHALAVAELPDHHRDPFDRMLVAQSQIDRFPIVTVDPAIERYDVDVVRADLEP